MTKITPCLWFDGQALEAARFYTSLLPKSHVDNVILSPIDTPGPKAGSVLLVEFTLAGQPYIALDGGPDFRFTEAISLTISCRDQQEVDRLWTALTADGGREVECGWLKDKYGLSWQIVPEALQRMLRDKDRAKAKRAMAAMMKMIKLDIAALEKAFAGP